MDNLSAWRSILENWGYQWIYQTDAFAKFKLPDPAQEAFVVDFTTVESATFAKLHAASLKLSFGDVQLHVPAPLHLIALKLHALKNRERFKLGKDLTDILQLIRICQIETSSIEFQKVLNQYANEYTRQALHLLLNAD